MRRGIQSLLLLIVLGAIAAGFAALYQTRLGAGDVFPPYSTFRADPLGLRAFYEALRTLPELTVERSLAPLAELPATPPRTLILAGMPAMEWEELSTEERAALAAAARCGGRVVVIFAPELSNGPSMQLREQWKKKKAAEKAEEEKNGGGGSPQKDAPAKKTKEASTKSDASEPAPVDWAHLWGVELASRWIWDRERGAEKSDGASADLPSEVAWKSDLYFELSPDSPWQTLYTRGGAPVLVERPFGQGSIVLATDAFFVSNEALQRQRQPALLSWLIGRPAQVAFDESHLGLIEHGGIAALARRYGLTAAFGVLLLLAALFIWRKMALFAPPAAATDEVALEFHPTAGLEALLRRALAPAQLFAACREEWRRTARPADAARLAAIDATRSPVEAHNAAIRALRRR